MIGGRTAAGRNRGRTGGRSAGDGGGRSGRGWHGVSRNRGRQIVTVVAAAYAGAGGGAYSCRPGGNANRQQAEGQREQQPGATSREPPAGRPDSNHRTRQGQPTTSGSRTGNQGQSQRQRPGRRSHQTRPRPRPPARSRNARARERYCWAAGQALRVRKRKIFLGKGSKNRFPGAGPGNSWGVKNATNGGE